MEYLKYDTVEKTYPEVLKKLQETFPDSVFEGKSFEITNDIEHEIVKLRIGTETFYLTRHQALDLSYALSRKAKQIVTKKRKMMG